MLTSESKKYVAAVAALKKDFDARVDKVTVTMGYKTGAACIDMVQLLYTWRNMYAHSAPR